MLTALQENPAYFVHSSLMDAIDAINADELTTAEIRKAESSIHAALRYLQIAKPKADCETESGKETRSQSDNP